MSYKQLAIAPLRREIQRQRNVDAQFEILYSIDPYTDESTTVSGTGILGYIALLNNLDPMGDPNAMTNHYLLYYGNRVSKPEGIAHEMAQIEAYLQKAYNCPVVIKDTPQS